jgi:hypothetical protein
MSPPAARSAVRPAKGAATNRPASPHHDGTSSGHATSTPTTRSKHLKTSSQRKRCGRSNGSPALGPGLTGPGVRRPSQSAQPGNLPTDNHDDDPAVITERLPITGPSAASPLPNAESVFDQFSTRECQVAHRTTVLRRLPWRRETCPPRQRRLPNPRFARISDGSIRQAFGNREALNDLAPRGRESHKMGATVSSRPQTKRDPSGMSAQVMGSPFDSARR